MWNMWPNALVIIRLYLDLCMNLEGILRNAKKE